MLEILLTLVIGSLLGLGVLLVADAFFEYLRERKWRKQFYGNSRSKQNHRVGAGSYAHHFAAPGSASPRFHSSGRAVNIALPSLTGARTSPSMNREPESKIDFKVAGVREWSINSYLELAPTNVGQPWQPGVNEAKCLPPYHPRLWTKGCNGRPRTREIPVVQPDCQCGFHAWYNYDPDRPRGGEVQGLILGWGRIAAHHQGMRCQYAEVVALFSDDNFTPKEHLLIKTVAKKYGVPVLHNPYDNLDMWVQELGGKFMPQEERFPPYYESELKDLASLYQQQAQFYTRLMMHPTKSLASLQGSQFGQVKKKARRN